VVPVGRIGLLLLLVLGLWSSSAVADECEPYPPTSGSGGPGAVLSDCRAVYNCAGEQVGTVCFELFDSLTEQDCSWDPSDMDGAACALGLCGTPVTLNPGGCSPPTPTEVPPTPTQPPPTPTDPPPPTPTQPPPTPTDPYSEFGTPCEFEEATACQASIVYNGPYLYVSGGVGAQAPADVDCQTPGPPALDWVLCEVRTFYLKEELDEWCSKERVCGDVTRMVLSRYMAMTNWDYDPPSFYGCEWYADGVYPFSHDPAPWGVVDTSIWKSSSTAWAIVQRTDRFAPMLPAKEYAFAEALCLALDADRDDLFNPERCALVPPTPTEAPPTPTQPPPTPTDPPPPTPTEAPPTPTQPPPTPTDPPPPTPTEAPPTPTQPPPTPTDPPPPTPTQPPPTPTDPPPPTPTQPPPTPTDPPPPTPTQPPPTPTDPPPPTPTATAGPTPTPAPTPDGGEPGSAIEASCVEHYAPNLPSEWGLCCDGVLYHPDTGGYPVEYQGDLVWRIRTNGGMDTYVDASGDVKEDVSFEVVRASEWSWAVVGFCGDVQVDTPSDLQAMELGQSLGARITDRAVQRSGTIEGAMFDALPMGDDGGIDGDDGITFEFGSRTETLRLASMMPPGRSPHRGMFTEALVWALRLSGAFAVVWLIIRFGRDASLQVEGQAESDVREEKRETERAMHRWRRG